MYQGWAPTAASLVSKGCSAKAPCFMSSLVSLFIAFLKKIRIFFKKSESEFFSKKDRMKLDREFKKLLDRQALCLRRPDTCTIHDWEAGMDSLHVVACVGIIKVFQLANVYYGRKQIADNSMRFGEGLPFSCPLPSLAISEVSSKNTLSNSCRIRTWHCVAHYQGMIMLDLGKDLHLSRACRRLDVFCCMDEWIVDNLHPYQKWWCDVKISKVQGPGCMRHITQEWIELSVTWLGTGIGNDWDTCVRTLQLGW